MTGLQCSRNQLASLDVSHNPDMYYLYCDGNQLKALDVSQNTALSYLDCGFNQLTSLDVSKNPALTTLYCCTNQIKGEAMDALISTLPQNTSTDVYGLYVYDSIALGEGNVCTQKQVATNIVAEFRLILRRKSICRARLVQLAEPPAKRPPLRIIRPLYSFSCQNPLQSAKLCLPLCF